MPNSKYTHQSITLLSAAAGLVPAYYIYGYTDFIAVCVFEAGILATLIAEYTPDLDVKHRRFNWLGNFIGLRAYAELVPHRLGLRKKHWSRLRVWNLFMFSHLPFIGTLPRSILLCLPVCLLFMLFGLSLEWLINYFVFLWLGMSYSDCWHVGADILTSDIKETKRSFWRKRSYARGKSHAR